VCSCKIEISLIVCRICSKVHHTHSILIHNLDDKVGLAQQESNFEFSNALSDNFQSSFFGTLSRQVGAVHDTQAKVGCVALRTVRHLLQGRHVIQKVQAAALLLVKTTQ